MARYPNQPLDAQTVRSALRSPAPWRDRALEKHARHLLLRSARQKRISDTQLQYPLGSAVFVRSH